MCSWLNAGIERVPLRPTGGSQFAKATVDEVLTSDVGLSDSGEMQGNQRVLLTITDGQFAGNQVEATSRTRTIPGAYCEPGLHVVVLVNQGQDGALVAHGVQLRPRVGALGAHRAVLSALCAVGGKSGMLSAVGLAFTFACIFLLFLPLVYSGASPFWSAVLVVVLVTVVGMYLIGGWSVKTFGSVVGTILGVLIAGGVASLFGRLGIYRGLT